MCVEWALRVCLAEKRSLLKQCSRTLKSVHIRGVRGSGKPHGNPIPMGIPWESHGNGNSHTAHDGDGNGPGIKPMGMGIAYTSRA